MNTTYKNYYWMKMENDTFLGTSSEHKKKITDLPISPNMKYSGIDQTI